MKIPDTGIVLKLLPYLLVLALLFPCFSSFAEDSGEAELLRSSIVSLNTVVRRTLTTLLPTNTDLPLSTKERDELLQFSLFLQTRVADYCRRLAELEGEQAVIELPCPPPDTPAGNSPALPEEPVTPQRQIASLDSELTAALGAFDEMLQAEEGRVSRQRTPAGSQGEYKAGGGKYSSGPAVSKDGTENETAPGSPPQNGRERHSGQQIPTPGEQADSVSGSGTGQEDSAYRQQSDRRGNIKVDDDIVARQLREAAEKEKDPVLKKKLWQEYYRYTGKKP